MAKPLKQPTPPPAPAGTSALREPSPAPCVIPLPTFLTWSEARDFLIGHGGLKELEARRALQSLPPAKLPGAWKKWHRLKLQEYCERLRTDADATLEEGVS